MEFSPLPSDYESWTAGQKQNFLWTERILPSKYAQIPNLARIDVLGLFLTPLKMKMDRLSDEAPSGWKKAIHAHGSVAKIKFVPTTNTPFSGLFKGASGLIRFSVTGDPNAQGFAPGLAVKFFVDGHPSENFSALVSLTGQGENHNLFAHEFSNIVPVVNKLGPRLINWIFMRVTRFPTKLYLQGLAAIDQKGHLENNPYYPYQIFLVPNPNLHFSENPHDFRDDLAKISAGTSLFSIYGVDPENLQEDADQASDIVDEQGYRQKAQLIGHLTTTSAFVSSSYGDSLLFFRHQRFGNE